MKEKINNTAYKKKELQKVDWIVAKRILAQIYTHGEINRTNLATGANISYDKLIRYLDWFEILDLITIRCKSNNKLKTVLLSSNGYDLFARKSSQLAN